MRVGSTSLVHRAASIVRACTATGPPSSSSIAAFAHWEASWQQPLSRALHGLISAYGSARHNSVLPTLQPCPHGPDAGPWVAATPAVWLTRHEGCRTRAVATPRPNAAHSSSAALSVPHQTAWQAGLHSSAAAWRDDGKGRDGDLRSEVHAADQQHRQPSAAAAASGTSAGGGSDGAALRFEAPTLTTCL